MENEIILTVFTPAYNRAHTLHRCYESLCRQKCKQFKWLIIDDGSSDNTKELVESWIKEDSGFEIIYHYKENGGMHTAHNAAYQLIDTELIPMIILLMMQQRRLLHSGKNMEVTNTQES